MPEENKTFEEEFDEIYFVPISNKFASATEIIVFENRKAQYPEFQAFIRKHIALAEERGRQEGFKEAALNMVNRGFYPSPYKAKNINK